MTNIKKETVEKVASKYNVDVNTLEAVVELIDESKKIDLNDLIRKVKSNIKA